MYTVSACVNDVSVVSVPLGKDWQLCPKEINEQLFIDPTIKIVYICSPGNPSGQLVEKHHIEQVLRHPTWNGIIVLDEAYIDFAPDDSSLAEWVLEWPNLVVLQTLSKSFGLAGIRLGVAFASTDVAQLLNNVKAPYNVSEPTSQLARMALSDEGVREMKAKCKTILVRKHEMMEGLLKIKGVGRLMGGADANFALVQMLDTDGYPSNEVALKVYEQLAEQHGIVVRFRGKELGCEGCLRITVGTEAEAKKFVDRLRIVLASIHDNKLGTRETAEETRKETDANDVIA
jgi:histidinol-phosphate aminotransferase